jgi:hypothetical protein
MLLRRVPSLPEGPGWQGWLDHAPLSKVLFMTGVQSGVPSVVQSKFCEPCNNRLTFRGGCYAPEDVNYMMYGPITSLCEQELGRSWSASSVRSHVEDVKNARG